MSRTSYGLHFLHLMSIILCPFEHHLSSHNAPIKSTPINVKDSKMVHFHLFSTRELEYPGTLISKIPIEKMLALPRGVGHASLRLPRQHGRALCGHAAAHARSAGARGTTAWLGSDVSHTWGVQGQRYKDFNTHN